MADHEARKPEDDDGSLIRSLPDADVLRVRDAIAMSYDDDIELVAPPDSVWDGIQAGLAGQPPVGASLPHGTQHVVDGQIPSDGDTASARRSTPVVDLSSERRRRRKLAPLVLGAAAAVFLVVGGLAVTGQSNDGTVVTTLALDPLRDDAATGEVSVIEIDDRIELDIALDDVAVESGYLELWVIDENVQDMVSLGPIRGDGRYLVPSGVELATYPVVDVSIEQPDGDPTHGGVSVLRGVIDEI